MKAKDIQELIDFISKTGLEEVDIETEAFKLKVKKSAEVKTQIVEAAASSAPVAAAVPVAAPKPQAPAAAPEPAAPAKTSDNNYVTVKSPMIGTFYRSSSPESDAFVKVGDSIKEGQTVCIIEAMKLFNEIEAELSGTVVKVLVENAQPVEFDQPLFLIDPS